MSLHVLIDVPRGASGVEWGFSKYILAQIQILVQG